MVVWLRGEWDPEKREEETVKKPVKNHDPINPYQEKTPASLCFELLREGHPKGVMLDLLKQQMSRESLARVQPEAVLKEFIKRADSEELAGFTVYKNKKGDLVLDRPTKEEREMAKRRSRSQVKKPVKRQVKKQVKKPVGRNVKIVASRNGANPWQPGFGAFCAMEILRAGGTMAEMEKRVQARFKKDGIASHPVNRLHRIIYVIDAQNEKVAKGFKITRKGKGKNQTLQAVKIGK